VPVEDLALKDFPQKTGLIRDSTTHFMGSGYLISVPGVPFHSTPGFIPSPLWGFVIDVFISIIPRAIFHHHAARVIGHHL